MDIFSIFKKRKKEPQDLSPTAILTLTQKYVPEFYRNSKSFIDSKEFLSYNEWGLALESLVEMANESGHYFSEYFWENLAICADKMKMSEVADYCREQIIKNERELGDKTPIGWTTIVVDSNTREHHVARIIEDSWSNKRHEKDNLRELLKTNGFHIKYHGRSGVIYYTDNGKVLEIGFDMSAVPQFDLLLYFDSLKGWTIPKDETFAIGEQETIKKELLEWLKSKRIKSDLE